MVEKNFNPLMLKTISQTILKSHVATKAWKFIFWRPPNKISSTPKMRQGSIQLL